MEILTEFKLSLLILILIVSVTLLVRDIVKSAEEGKYIELIIKFTAITFSIYLTLIIHKLLN